MLFCKIGATQLYITLYDAILCLFHQAKDASSGLILDQESMSVSQICKTKLVADLARVGYIHFYELLRNDKEMV